MWGRGWYYPPYCGLRRVLSVLLSGTSRPTGTRAWYNPWTGAYGRSAGVYGPYGGAGVGARYNPRTGTYARGAAAYGPYGARGVAQAYNPRTGTYAATRQGSNVYGSWGSTAVQRGDDWAKTNRYTNRQTGNDDAHDQDRRGRRGDAPRARRRRVGAGAAATSTPGKTATSTASEDGTWQKYDNGGWTNTDRQPSGDRPTPSDRSAAASGRASTDRSTIDQLNRDAAARSQGRSGPATPVPIAALQRHGRHGWQLRRRRVTWRRRAGGGSSFRLAQTGASSQRVRRQRAHVRPGHLRWSEKESETSKKPWEQLGNNTAQTPPPPLVQSLNRVRDSTS